MAELHAVPKALRTPAVERRMARRLTRRAALERASAQRRRTSYGGSDWRQAKWDTLARDHWKCVLCGKQAEVVHHLRHVAAGGTNEPQNLASLCNWDHALVHDGLIPRQRLYDVLSERYGYIYG